MLIYPGPNGFYWLCAKLTYHQSHLLNLNFHAQFPAETFYLFPSLFSMLFKRNNDLLDIVLFDNPIKSLLASKDRVTHNFTSLFPGIIVNKTH